MEMGVTTMENMEGLQNIKNRTTVCPSNSTSGFIFKRIKIRIPTFIEALSSTDKI